MDTKQFTTGFQVKADTPGAVQAVFATYNVVDKVRDVLLPGSIPDGVTVPMLYAHDMGALPIGKGVVTTTREYALFTGAFNLETTAGRDAYQSVKFQGDLQQWSFAYRILDAEYGVFDERPVQLIKALELYEVSPVLVGAGEGTHTVGVKSAPAAQGPLDDRERGIRLLGILERVADAAATRAVQRAELLAIRKRWCGY